MEAAVLTKKLTVITAASWAVASLQHLTCMPKAFINEMTSFRTVEMSAYSINFL
jgi:hypothetical protein